MLVSISFAWSSEGSAGGVDTRRCAVAGIVRGRGQSSFSAVRMRVGVGVVFSGVGDVSHSFLPRTPHFEVLSSSNVPFSSSLPVPVPAPIVPLAAFSSPPCIPTLTAIPRSTPVLVLSSTVASTLSALFSPLRSLSSRSLSRSRSGEGVTWRIVERLLIAVGGRPDDDCGVERGAKCVVRFIGVRCVGIHVGVGGAGA